jgi:hypothetical protein
LISAGDVWRPPSDLQGPAFFPVENEAFYPVRAKVWPDSLSLLTMAFVEDGGLWAKAVPLSGKE